MDLSPTPLPELVGVQDEPVRGELVPADPEPRLRLVPARRVEHRLERVGALPGAPIVPEASELRGEPGVAVVRREEVLPPRRETSPDRHHAPHAGGRRHRAMDDLEVRPGVDGARRSASTLERALDRGEGAMLTES